MKILLTGFEPFGQSSINPSDELVKALATQRFADFELVTAVLPVDRFRGPQELLVLVQQHSPDAVVCLGEASRRAAISIERVAVNLLDFGIADNTGHQAQDEPIVPDGPAAYFTTLPVRAMQQAVVAAGIPAELSLSAGAYLCNQVTYELLYFLAEQGQTIPAGFVHLPQLPEQVANQRPLRPSMALQTMITAVTILLQSLHHHLTNNT